MSEMFYSLTKIIENSPVLSSVFSGLFIAILFSMIYPRYLNWLSRAKLKFVFPFDKKSVIELKVIPNAAGPQFELGIENNGIKTISNAYWHIFIVSKKQAIFTYNLEKYEIDGNNRPSNIGSVMPKIEKLDDDWWHYSGMIDGPMFPKRKISFPYDIRWEINFPGIYNVYYYFVTEFGVSPNKARKFKLDKQINRINKNLDKITIKVKQI